MLNILLCDDHEIVRKGLRQILEGYPEFRVTTEVSSGEQLLRELRKAHPHVIILDLSLPGRSGLEVLKQVRALYPEINVLVLSMYPEEQFAVRAIKAGASGYLHKDSPPEVLYKAIRMIARGGKYINPALACLLFEEIMSERPQPTALHKNLSDREFEVLLLLGEGKKISEIAQRMSLSAKTVSTYKIRIFEKLNLKNLAQVTRYLMEHNIAQAPSETLSR